MTSIDSPARRTAPQPPEDTAAMPRTPLAARISPTASASLLVLGVALAGILAGPIAAAPIAIVHAAVITHVSIAHGRRAGLTVATMGGCVLVLGALHWGAAGRRPDHAGLLVALAGLGLLLPPLIERAIALRRRGDTRPRTLGTLEHLGREPDLRTALEVVTTAASLATAADGITIALDRQPDGLLVAAEHTSLDLPMRIGDRLEPDDGPGAAAALEHRTVVANDLARSARWGAWARAAGTSPIRAAVAIPLEDLDGVFGSLTAWYATTARVPVADITELTLHGQRASALIAYAHAYNAERQAAEQLRSAQRLRGDFLATVTHELRTPLTTITGFLDTVLLHNHELGDADRERMLIVARRNAGELARRISSILEFSRLEGEHVALTAATQTLAPVIRRSVENSQGLCDDHELRLELDEDLVAHVDPTAIDHILGNLLGNAVKYAPQDSVIIIRAQSDDGEAVVSICDHGPGIALDEQPRVFESFYRARQNDVSVKGSGIGLAVVARYVRLGGGRVWVESEPGEGACFSFSLPLTRQPSELDNPLPSPASMV